MDQATKAALDRARAQLADARPDGDHDHRGPRPCPVCGGLPAETPAATSFHPVRERTDSNEESSE